VADSESRCKGHLMKVRQKKTMGACENCKDSIKEGTRTEPTREKWGRGPKGKSQKVEKSRDSSLLGNR